MRPRLILLLVILMLSLALLGMEIVLLGWREVFNSTSLEVIALFAAGVLLLGLLTLVSVALDWPEESAFSLYWKHGLEPDAPELPSKGELLRLIRLKRSKLLRRLAGRIRDSAARTSPSPPLTPDPRTGTSGQPATADNALDRLLWLKRQASRPAANGGRPE